MHILILGAKGQLGLALSALFETQGLSYTSCSKQECNITNISALREVMRSNNPTHIINCAAYVNIDAAESDEGRQLNTLINTEGQQHVITCAEEIGAHVTYISTDYVFDSKKQSPHTEDDPTNPLNNYGKAKLHGEMVTTSYEQGLVLRASWLYGESEHNFIYKFLQFAKKKDVLPCTHDEVSVPTSTNFLSQIILNCISHNLTGLYHAAPRGYASRADWARKIVELAQLHNTITECSINDWGSPAERSTFSAMSSDTLASKLEVQFPTWEEDLEHFFQTTSHWVDSVKSA